MRETERERERERQTDRKTDGERDRVKVRQGEDIQRKGERIFFCYPPIPSPDLVHQYINIRLPQFVTVIPKCPDISSTYPPVHEPSPCA